MALQEETKKKQSTNNKLFNQNSLRIVLKTINLMLYQSRNHEAQILIEQTIADMKSLDFASS